MVNYSTLKSKRNFEPYLMLFLYLFICGTSKTIYLNVTASKSQKCDDELGCNINEVNSTLEVNDNIVILNPILDKDDAKNFLDFINSTVSKNISLTGRSKNSNFTIISNPGYPASEFASIHVENSTFSISFIHFKSFLNPILNGMRSNYIVENCTFSKSKCTASALLAFVESEITFNNTKIHDNDANTQSLFIAVNSSVTLYRLNASTNFMESRDIRAAFHFLNSSVLFNNSLFFSNTLKLPLIASSNYSHIRCLETSFDFNNAFCVIAIEFYSTAKFEFNYFHNNNCALAAGGINSTFYLGDSSVLNHNSEEFLIALSEADIMISNCTFKDSIMASIAYHNLVTNLTKTMAIENVTIINLNSKVTLFTAISGIVTIENIIVDSVKSEAEVVIFSQQGDGSCIIKNATLNGIKSESKVSTALSVMNTTSFTLTNFKMVQNLVCGALFENTKISIHDSHFLNNQCLPQGNAIPLAILTATLSNDIIIDDCKFENNVALSGSLFFLNATSSIKNMNFIGNQAVQGAAIFSAGTNFTAKNVTFNDNKGMAMGGALMLTQTNSDIDNCTFSNNQAPEGASIVLRDSYEIKIRNSVGVRNNSTNGSFINAEGENILLTLENIEVDDPFDYSMFLQFPEKVVLKNAKFNCKVKCQNVEKLTPRPVIQIENNNKNDIKKNEEKKNNENVKENNELNKNKEFDDLDNPDVDNENEQEIQDLENLANNSDNISLPIIWVMIPLSFIIASILFIKCGPRGLQKAFNKIFRTNAKHEL